jgi:hypothetical protein
MQDGHGGLTSNGETSRRSHAQVTRSRDRLSRKLLAAAAKPRRAPADTRTLQICVKAATLMWCAFRDPSFEPEFAPVSGRDGVG